MNLGSMPSINVVKNWYAQSFEVNILSGSNCYQHPTTNLWLPHLLGTRLIPSPSCTTRTRSGPIRAYHLPSPRGFPQSLYASTLAKEFLIILQKLIPLILLSRLAIRDNQDTCPNGEKVISS